MRKVLAALVIATAVLASVGVAGATSQPTSLVITLCHSTGVDTWVPVTQDVTDLNLVASTGHVHRHVNDIVPPYTFTHGQGNQVETVVFSGRGDQSILANGCVKPAPPVTTTTTSTTLPAPEEHKVTLCHAVNGEGELKNGYNEITVDTDSVTKNNGHDSHDGDVIPAFDGYAGKNLGNELNLGVPGTEFLDNHCTNPNNDDEIDVCRDGQVITIESDARLETDTDAPCPAPPVDVCKNLEGNQAEVPDGLILVGDNCVEQSCDNDSDNCPPPPPVDACKNIDGIQETVPDGYSVNEDGNCYPPKPDPAVNVSVVCDAITVNWTNAPDATINTIVNFQHGPIVDHVTQTGPTADGSETFVHSSKNGGWASYSSVSGSDIGFFDGGNVTDCTELVPPVVTTPPAATPTNPAAPTLPAGTPETALAFTGADVFWIGLIGLLVLVAGALVVTASRKPTEA